MKSKARIKKLLTAGGAMKAVRVVVSLVFLALMTVVMTTLEAKVAIGLGWVARIQIMPLALASSVSVLGLWVAVTMLFGRVYCSSICPFGVMQDIFAHLPRFTKKQRRRHRYGYEPAKNKLRYGVLAAVVLSAVFGFGVMCSLLDPYSAYGRIATELFVPIVEWVGGAPVVIGSIIAFGVALATLVIVGSLAAWRGRLFCNTLCPVGATLGIFSRFSVFHFDIDTDLCVNCGECGRRCKAECINLADHMVDSSRCVVCFNCVDACSTGAIRYTARRKRLSIPMMQRVSATTATTATVNRSDLSSKPVTPPSADVSPCSEPVKIDRRQFLATGLIIAAAPVLDAATKTSNRIAAIETGGKPLVPKHYVVPPGRRSITDFLEKCTGCGLCVAHCPTHVLRPSSRELGWVNMLHPVMDYDRGYCLYNCTRCTELCPTGALLPLTPTEKHTTVIGLARIESANCIGCGACVSRCPQKAIELVARPGKMAGSSLIARVDVSRCIGCGACEYICPASPLKAIVVEGFA